MIIILYICTRKGRFRMLCLQLVPERGYFMRLGEYIRNKRKTFRLTQVELAERSGVGIRFVRELEAGKPTVQMDKVNQVLNLFGEELRPEKIVE